jgi:hypothetical protein
VRDDSRSEALSVGLTDGSYRNREHGYQLDSRTFVDGKKWSSVDASHAPARNLNVGRTAVVRNAAQ